MSIDVEQLLRDLSGSNFWGVLELKFQGGKVTTVRKTEMLVTNDYQFGKRPRPEVEVRDGQHTR